MTIKEFFQIVAPKLGLASSDIDAIIESGTISDELKHIPEAAKALMTQEGAIGNEAVRNKVMARILEDIDKTILDSFQAKYGDHIDAERFSEITGHKKTSDKVLGLFEMLSGSFGSEIETLKNAGNVSDELRTQLQTLREALTTEKAAAAELTQQLTAQKSEFEKQRLIDRMKTHLFSKKFKTEDADIREYFINEKIVSPAFNQAKFEFGEDGKIKVKNHADPSLPLFVGDDQTNPVSFEGFMDYLGKDYFAKNDAKPKMGTTGSALKITEEQASRLKPHMIEAIRKNKRM